MHIVFLGNCQVGALAAIVQRFVAPHVDITTEFVDAYYNVSSASYRKLERADIVVAQASRGTPQLGTDLVPPGVPIHLVPVVSGAFLYPYHGVPHPANPAGAGDLIPFTPEFNDRYLAKLYMAKATPEDALRQYRALDVAASASVARLYEVTIEAQRELDARTGYACADLIERHLGEEQVFQTAFHFAGRIARHLAAPLCDRLGFDPKYGQRIRDHLRQAPFIRLSVPVHPSIARHFDMQWARDDTRYPYLFEGSFTFDEYVLRFMDARWSATLHAGIAAAGKGDPAAKAWLETGLREAPRSAEGAQALSVILEREGDLHGALALQRRAQSSAADAGAFDAGIPFRLGQLLLRTGDPTGAEAAFRDAVSLDPVNHHAWLALSRIQRDLGKVDSARRAAMQAALHAADPSPPQSRAGVAPDQTPLSAELVIPQDNQSGQPSCIDMIAHIQNRGDTLSDLHGVAGLPGSRLAVEGFMTAENAISLGFALAYQAVLADKSLSARVEAGGYCGTRGQNAPLYGLSVSVSPTSKAITYEAWFINGEHVGPVAAGTVCKANDHAPLEALRICLANDSLKS